MNSALEENHMHGGKMWRPGIILMAVVIGEGVHCSSMTSSSPPPPGGKWDHECRKEEERSLGFHVLRWPESACGTQFNFPQPGSKWPKKKQRHADFPRVVLSFCVWKIVFCPLNFTTSSLDAGFPQTFSGVAFTFRETSNLFPIYATFLK